MASGCLLMHVHSYVHILWHGHILYVATYLLKIFIYLQNIKTHDSESQGQEEALTIE